MRLGVKNDPILRYLVTLLTILTYAHCPLLALILGGCMIQRAEIR